MNVLRAKLIYSRMNKFSCWLVALTALVASLEAISREAEPAEPDCPAVAPCADRQLIALPPDGHESESDVTAAVDTISVTNNATSGIVIEQPLQLDIQWPNGHTGDL